MRTYLTYISLSLVIIPFFTFAATAPKDFRGFVGMINDIIGMLILVVFSLTFLVVIWGIIKGWVINGGEAEGVETGKKVVLAGVIALVIMSSVWGIVYLIQNSLFNLS